MRPDFHFASFVIGRFTCFCCIDTGETAMVLFACTGYDPRDCETARYGDGIGQNAGNDFFPVGIISCHRFCNIGMVCKGYYPAMMGFNDKTYQGFNKFIYSYFFRR